MKKINKLSEISLIKIDTNKYQLNVPKVQNFTSHREVKSLNSKVHGLMDHDFEEKCANYALFGFIPIAIDASLLNKHHEFAYEGLNFHCDTVKKLQMYIALEVLNLNIENFQYSATKDIIIFSEELTENEYTVDSGIFNSLAKTGVEEVLMKLFSLEKEYKSSYNKPLFLRAEIKKTFKDNEKLLKEVKSLIIDNILDTLVSIDIKKDLDLEVSSVISELKEEAQNSSYEDILDLEFIYNFSQVKVIKKEKTLKKINILKNEYLYDNSYTLAKVLKNIF